jgi:hypothetical protein
MSATGIAVRFSWAASRPLMVPVLTFVATLASTMFVRVVPCLPGVAEFVREDVAVSDDVTEDIYNTKVTRRRLAITESESFGSLPAQVLVVAGCLVATGFALAIYSDPMYAAAVFVCCVALACVCFTPWYTFEHEVSTLFLVSVLLGACVAVCVAFLRVDPAYPPWAYGVLVGVALALAAMFGFHPVAVRLIREAAASKRPVWAWLERERVALFELLMAAVLVVAFLLVGGVLAP